MDVNCDLYIDNEMAVSDQDKIIAWRSYQEKLLNTEFAQGKNSLFESNTISSVPCVIEKGMIRELIRVMKNGKAVGASGLVESVLRQMLKSAENPTI